MIPLELFSPAEAAASRFAGKVSPDFLRDEFERGRLPGRRIGKRIFFTAADLEAYDAACRERKVLTYRPGVKAIRKRQQRADLRLLQGAIRRHDMRRGER